MLDPGSVVTVIGQLIIVAIPAVIALLAGYFGGQWTGRPRARIKDDLAILAGLRAANLPADDVEGHVKRDVALVYGISPEPRVKPWRAALPSTLAAIPFVVAGSVVFIERSRWNLLWELASTLYTAGVSLLTYAGYRYSRVLNNELLDGFQEVARLLDSAVKVTAPPTTPPKVNTSRDSDVSA